VALESEQPSADSARDKREPKLLGHLLNALGGGGGHGHHGGHHGG